MIERNIKSYLVIYFLLFLCFLIKSKKVQFIFTFANSLYEPIEYQKSSILCELFNNATMITAHAIRLTVGSL